MIEYIIGAFTENALLYSCFTVPFFLIFWGIGKKYFAQRRIQSPQQNSHFYPLHDLGFSLNSFFIFAVIDGGMVYLADQGYTLLYFDVADYGWAWALCSCVLVLVIEDSFFYWSHRLMHHPKLFRYFHSVHHKSTSPNPFTCFAFNPTEAVVQTFVYCVLPFVLPLHFGVILFWQLFGMLSNVLAHLGYELYPKNWTQLPILRLKTTSTHHNMHHELFHGNYALHFTWWDKWIGTEFPDTEQRHRTIFEQQAANPTPEPASIPQPLTMMVTAQLGAETYQFKATPSETILKSALAQAVPLPHLCQNGLCGRCKLKCTQGQVEMLNSKLLTSTELKSGIVLTCQSIPVSTEITIQS